jgi:hypothetical protein
MHISWSAHTIFSNLDKLTNLVILTCRFTFWACRRPTPPPVPAQDVFADQHRCTDLADLPPEPGDAKPTMNSFSDKKKKIDPI